MSKRSDEEERAFAEAMRGAKPLAPDGHGRVPPRPEKTPGAAARRAHAAATRLPLDESRAPTESTTFEVTTVGETIAARAAGVDLKLLRRLKAGEPRVEARLDLHGRAREDAQDALERFVDVARAEGRRCVLVIHGRGAHSDEAPVLKPLVWHWLAVSSSAAAAVLAFASAPPAEGGDGATRVLLRKLSR